MHRALRALANAQMQGQAVQTHPRRVVDEAVALAQQSNLYVAGKARGLLNTALARVKAKGGERPCQGCSWPTERPTTSHAGYASCAIASTTTCRGT